LNTRRLPENKEQQETIEYCRALKTIILEKEENDLAFYNETVAFSKELIDRYGDVDVRGCLLYHVLIGSTMIREPSSFDLPSDHSVVLFLERLAQQLEPEGFKSLKAKRSLP
jgi:hypothetical protein